MCTKQNWADLVPEILGLILSRLHGKDVPVVGAVCRSWNSVTATMTNCSKHIQISDMIKYPFLFSYRGNSSASSSSTHCELYSPAYNKTYSIKAPLQLPGLENAQIHSSDFGWLLVSIGRRCFFFLQPVTGDVINLPRFNNRQRPLLLNEMSFSAPPTSPHCVVFGFGYTDPPRGSYARLAFIRRGDSRWRSVNYDYPHKARLKFYRCRLVGSKVKPNRCAFRPVPCKAITQWSSSCSAPVFHNGAFHCVSRDGRLWVFDPRKNQRRNMWRLLLDTNTVYNAISRDRRRNDKVYLMKSSKGELISVAVGLRGEFLRMFKYNDDLHLWQRLCSLKGQVAFLSPTSSIVLSCKELHVNGLENTIHFPSFERNCNAFYSLSTRRFHSFRGGYTSDHTSHNELLLNSTWMMPEFRHYSHQQLDWNNTDPSKEEGDDIQVDPSYFINGFNFSQPKQDNVDTSTRSMTRAPNKASPWIILSHEDNTSAPRTFVDLVTNVSHSDDSMVKKFRGKKVYGCSNNGLVLLVDYESGDCDLLNTTSMNMDPLPTLKMPKYFKKTCCLIHQPLESCETVVTIFGLIETKGNGNKPMMIFCRVGDKKWTRCTEEIVVEEAVSYQGKIYGIPRIGYFWSFIQMKLHQKHYDVRRIEGFEDHNLQRTGQMGCHKRIMVESCGELLYFETILYDHRHTDILQDVTDVRVFRMDMEGMRMELVKDLGDRAFFFSGPNVWFECCASEYGFERNSIYFVVEYKGVVRKYDYGRHCISTVYSTRDEAKNCKIDGLLMFQ